MLNQVDTVRNAVLNIEELVQQVQQEARVLSKVEKLRVYNLVEGFIFHQIGFDTLIGAERITVEEAIKALKGMIEPAKREHRELDDLEKEIIRCNAKSLLLALGFK